MIKSGKTLLNDNIQDQQLNDMIYNKNMLKLLPGRSQVLVKSKSNLSQV